MNENLSNKSTYDLIILKPDYLGTSYWNLKELTPIAVIFGKNGSGKSILLRQIRNLTLNYIIIVYPKEAEISRINLIWSRKKRMEKHEYLVLNRIWGPITEAE